MIRVGFVFHKDPLQAAAGIDIIRLHALTGGLLARGLGVDIIAPVDRPGQTPAGVPVYPLDHLAHARYDALKTCYHFSLELIGDYDGPVVSRIVRVVDDELPERDMAWRGRLLACQETIAARSSVVVLNNGENEQRWLARYGKTSQASTLLIRTGCPAVIPRKGKNPYAKGEKVMLFLGSLCSARMVAMLNALADALRDAARIHHIGRSKLHIYDDGSTAPLSPLIVRHGEMPERETWNYVRHACIGLAIAPGPYSFDNDLSKIYGYLRGGLPVLSEERIINNELIAAMGHGQVFAYDDIDDAAGRARRLLRGLPSGGGRRVMASMARAHAWERRVDQYYDLFTRLQAGAQNACPD